MISELKLKMINYFGKDTKRINHALKVYEFAEIICSNEDLYEDEKNNLLIAAVFHDIGIKEAERKHNSSSGKYQEIEGPSVAKNILQEYDISDKNLERILFLIGNHHSYTKTDGIDFQILVEADFLVNIFEDEMNKESIESIKKKIFKTRSGIKLIETLY